MNSGIILHKQPKGDYPENGSPGEICFATDTKEVGVRNSDGILIWFDWENEIPYIFEEELNSFTQYKNGTQKINLENNSLAKYSYSNGTWLKIDYSGATLEQLESLLLKKKDAEKYLGAFTNKFINSYTPINPLSPEVEGNVSPDDTPNAVKLDGSTEVTIDYETAPDNSLVTFENVFNDILDIFPKVQGDPCLDPRLNGGDWYFDSNNKLTKLENCPTFFMEITSSNEPVIDSNGGSVTVVYQEETGKYIAKSYDNITSFKFSGDRSSITEIFWYDAPESLISLNSAFFGLNSLQTFNIADGKITSNVADFSTAWCDCFSLTSFPQLDVSNGVDFSWAWGYCRSLTSFPILDVSNGTDFSSAWYDCSSLTSFPQLDASNGVDFSDAWYNCSSLTSFPDLDVSNGTDFRGAWWNCSSLTSFPVLDVSNGTNFSSAWYDCSSLTSFPVLDVSNGTNFSSAWYDCSSLTSFPVLNVSNGTDFGYAWSSCSSLTSFPQLDVSNGVDFSHTWYDCTNLPHCPAGNEITIPSGANTFNMCSGRCCTG